MPPKPAVKKTGKAAAEPVVEAAPVRVNRWIDIDATFYQEFLATKDVEMDWASFNEKAFFPCDPNTCDHRHLIVLEYCLVFLNFCRDNSLNFDDASFVMQLVQSSFQMYENEPSTVSVNALSSFYHDKVPTVFCVSLYKSSLTILSRYQNDGQQA
jgi:hypothetical protein